MAKKNKKKKPERMRSLIFRRIYEAALRNGHIDVTGKTEKEAEEEFEKYYQSLDDPTIIFTFVVDHRSNLLNKARLFAAQEDYHLACLLYATWIEHWVNNLIDIVGIRKRMDREEVALMIRELTFRAKITWFLKLVGLKPLYSSHRNAILKITDLRNAFVHYKWKDKDEKDDEKADKELKKCVENIEKTVNYLKTFEQKSLLKSKLRSVRKIAVRKATEVENRTEIYGKT